MARTANRAIRIGIGGWTYERWRGAFYPDKFPQKSELEYASPQITTIAINGTFYGSQKPETYAKWRDETPDGFVFSLKATHLPAPPHKEGCGWPGRPLSVAARPV